MSRVPTTFAIVVTAISVLAVSLPRCAGGDKAELDRYLQLLDDKDSLVRKQALLQLERLGSKGIPALSKLTKLLGHGEPKVRAWAARSLGQMGAEAKPAIDDLISSLNDTDSEARAARAEALDLIDEQSRLTALMSQMTDAKIEKAKRCAACKEMAARFSTLPAVRAALQKALTDDDLKASAAEGLEAIDRASKTPPTSVVHHTEHHRNVLFALAFNPYGKRFFTAGEDRVIKMWDAETKKLLATLKGHKHSIGDLAVTSDGRRVASGGYDRTVRVWDIAAGKECLTIERDFDVYGKVAFSPDGKRIAVGESLGKRIWIFDTDKGQELLCFKSETAHIRALTFSPDGNRLAAALGFSSGNGDGVTVWDAATGKFIYGFGSPGVSALAYSPDGQRLAVGTSGVPVLNASDGKMLFQCAEKRGGILGVRWLPGGLLAFGTHEERVRDSFEFVVADAETRKEVLKMKVGSLYLHGFATSRDGRFLAGFGKDFFSSNVNIWDLSSLIYHHMNGAKEGPGRSQK